MKTFQAILLALSVGANVYQWLDKLNDADELAASRALTDRALRVAMGYRSDLAACQAIRIMPTVAL